MMVRRIAGLPLLLAAGAVMAGPLAVAAQGAPTPAPTTSAVPSGPAGQVVALGTVSAHATYGLGFGRDAAVVPPGAATSGATSPGPWLVTSVSVAPGDVVARGDVLATAEDAVLRLQLDAAQTAADYARAKLAKDLARPTEGDIARADAALGQARQRLDAAEQSLADTQAQSEAATEGAQDALEGAQELLDSDTSAGQSQAVIAADGRAVAAATSALRNVVAAGAANDRRAQQAVDAAVLALDLAELDYQAAIAPSTPDVTTADQAALAAAELNLSRAQVALDGATIVSPVDGTVGAVSLAVGVNAPVGDNIQVQEGPMEVTAQIAEGDVVTLAIGQPVAATVVALGLPLTGSVTAISPRPGSAPAATVVTYPVTITLDEPPPGMLPGMTVKVVVTTDAGSAPAG